MKISNFFHPFWDNFEPKFFLLRSVIHEWVEFEPCTFHSFDNMNSLSSVKFPLGEIAN